MNFAAITETWSCQAGGTIWAPIHTLREISKLEGFHGKLLVVATKLDKQSGERFKGDWRQSRDYQNIAASVKEEGFDIPVLPLKLSKVFDAIFEKEMSIAQIRESDPLAGFTYREVAAQFDEIYSYIDQVSHAQKKQPLSA